MAAGVMGEGDWKKHDLPGLAAVVESADGAASVAFVFFFTAHRKPVLNFVYGVESIEEGVVRWAPRCTDLTPCLRRFCGGGDFRNFLRVLGGSRLVPRVKDGNTALRLTFEKIS